MVDKEKLARLVTLQKTLEDTEREITELLGGEPVKQKRQRRTKAEMDAARLPQTQL